MVAHKANKCNRIHEIFLKNITSDFDKRAFTTVKIQLLKAWQQYIPQIHGPLMSWWKIRFSHALLAREKNCHPLYPGRNLFPSLLCGHKHLLIVNWKKLTESWFGKVLSSGSVHILFTIYRNNFAGINESSWTDECSRLQ